MKSIFKRFIAIKLYVFTRLQLTLAKPYVIAIIGTSNRSLVKEVVHEVLLRKTSVHSNEPQWNAEIGIPLTILRTNVVAHSFIGWFMTLWKAWIKIFSGKYPKIVVVEVAFNAKGDMRHMSKLLRPNAIVINDMQPLGGRSFVNEKIELEKEYLAMTKRGSKKDVVIISADLPEKDKVREATKRTVVEYSVQGNAQYNATSEGSNIKVTTSHGEEYYKTNIPGDAAKAAFAVATILKEKVS